MTTKNTPNMKTSISMGKLALAFLLLFSNARARDEGGLGASSPIADVTRPHKADRLLRSRVHVDGVSTAVSSRGKLVTSSKGTDWTEVRLTFRTFLRGITHANGLYVA